MPIHFNAIATDHARHIQTGGKDANGQMAERRLSSGSGTPCRHCLQYIKAGEAYLIAAYRPFQTIQPYAETGPIFLHAALCQRAEPDDDLPAILDGPDFILRGYDGDERIVSGTGAVIARSGIKKRAEALLLRDDIVFVDIRSARNNCFLCRVQRFQENF